MNFVEPIRNVKKIAQIKNLLRAEGRYRDLLLFVIGINSALRVSDLVRLQVHHVLTVDREIVSSFTLREQKTHKRHDVTINESIRGTLQDYLSAYPDVALDPANALFFSLKPLDYHKPISRWQAWDFVSTACHEVGLTGEYGTHTMRKTWAYHARLSGVPMEVIMNKLNHSNFAATQRYLGITDDELQAAVLKLNL